jgi:protein FAM32A
MPSSDYTASGGGALKLKGSAGINKSKKKKKKSKPSDDTATKTKRGEPSDTKPEEKDEVNAESSLHASSAPHKTDAEIHFEEKKRRRLEERLKKDGSKTHKEKVEELNRYLSKLSEHHDMWVLLFSCFLKHC